jgi:tRNA threonylcarbamoyladenosine biosynthesis protein TsaB
MPSFRQISAHFPALVIDAASSEIHVGLLESPDPADARWQASTDEAGVAVFEGVKKLGVELSSIRAFVFCEGPGSVLGIRTVAMALRTWLVLGPRPVFAYASLALVAHALGREDIGVIADARRDSWHHYRIGDTLRRVPTTELAGELVMPENFRHWSALPAQVTRVPYSLAELLQKTWEADVLRETDSPDAFLHEEPNYVRWTPQIHRAPGARGT